MRLERIDRQYLVDGTTQDTAAVIACQITDYTPPRPVYATAVQRTLSGLPVIQNIGKPILESEIGLFFEGDAEYADFLASAHHPHRLTDERDVGHTGALEIKSISKGLPRGAYTVAIVFRAPSDLISGN